MPECIKEVKMAVVDFSKAKVEMFESGGGQSPAQVANINMGPNFYKTFPYKDKDGKDRTRTNAEVINAYSTFQRHLKNGADAYMFTGTFKDSGTSFVIMANNGYRGWKVSNVRFSEDDVYVFAIIVNVPYA